MKRFLLANAIQSATGLNTSLFSSLHMVTVSCISRTKKLLPAIALLFFTNALAQQKSDTTPDTAYQRVIAERAAKIVNNLGITDILKTEKVQKQIEQQYFQLNSIHDNSKATVAAIKSKPLSKDEISEAVKKEDENKSLLLRKLHAAFIAGLKTTLSDEQLEKVKDGMTYRILPVTWTAYMDMLQSLTQEQKDKMYTWLLEARELAMDEGSSDAKHAVFGKYKGKINNYLSAAGYDMKKEGEDWAKRIQAEKEAKKNQN